MARSVGILGSTGSIGTQTLSVIRELSGAPESESNPHFTVKMLACGRNRELMLSQIKEFRPGCVCVACEQDAAWLSDELSGSDLSRTEILFGEDGLVKAAGIGVDILVTAISGMRGLLPTLSAIDAGSDIALANKETLVAAGNIVMDRAREKGVRILPVDSEHSAVFQCLESSFKGGKGSVFKIILTASGGPFRTSSYDELKTVTVAQALAHPTWRMGGKITVDCATMMNKGLEVIEAMHLFGMPPEKIGVLVHPESIVHSMVEFTDGSVIAQLGVPDMKTPIRLALTYPYRGISCSERLDLSKVRDLTFEKPRTDVFRCLAVALEAAKTGGTVSAAMNGANEAAVELFFNGSLSFTGIADAVEDAVNAHMKDFVPVPGLEEILEADRRAREYVRRRASCR